MIVFTLVVLGIASAAFGGDQQDAPSPLRQLDFLVGSWTCSAEVFETALGPGRKSSGTAELAWGHDGHWLAFTYAEKKSAAAPMPVTFSGYMGYDAELKKFVVVGVDSFGGYNTASGDGMSGDALVFTGPWHMGTMTAKGRDTFMRKPDGGIVHWGEVEMDGKWVKYGQESCRK